MNDTTLKWAIFLHFIVINISEMLWAAALGGSRYVC